jgi:hypothetical protein
MKSLPEGKKREIVVEERGLKKRKRKRNNAPPQLSLSKHDHGMGSVEFSGPNDRGVKQHVQLNLKETQKKKNYFLRLTM